jgi:hypothetical protein
MPLTAVATGPTPQGHPARDRPAPAAVAAGATPPVPLGAGPAGATPPRPPGAGPAGATPPMPLAAGAAGLTTPGPPGAGPAGATPPCRSASPDPARGRPLIRSPQNRPTPRPPGLGHTPYRLPQPAPGHRTKTSPEESPNRTAAPPRPPEPQPRPIRARQTRTAPGHPTGDQAAGAGATMQVREPSVGVGGWPAAVWLGSSLRDVVLGRSPGPCGWREPVRMSTYEHIPVRAPQLAGHGPRTYTSYAPRPPDPRPSRPRPTPYGLTTARPGGRRSAPGACGRSAAARHSMAVGHGPITWRTR